MCFKTVCNEVQMFAVKNRENVLCRELCLVLHGSLDGKGVWGKWINVYVWLSLYAVHLKLSQHCQLPISSVQFSRSVVSNSATPWIVARQASLSITNSRSLPKLMSIDSVMPSRHLILCCPLLLLPAIPPSIKVFSNESILCIRWPKYWSFRLSISPSNQHPGLISFRRDWLDLLADQGTRKSLLQHHSSKASILQSSAFFTVLLLHPYMTTGKTIANLYFMKNYLWIVVIIFKSTEKLCKK